MCWERLIEAETSEPVRARRPAPDCATSAPELTRIPELPKQPVPEREEPQPVCAVGA